MTLTRFLPLCVLALAACQPSAAPDAKKSGPPAVSITTAPVQLRPMELRIGSLDQLSLLSVQRSWVASRDSRAQSRFDSLQSGLTLYKALGGGWQPQ